MLRAMPDPVGFGFFGGKAAKARLSCPAWQGDGAEKRTFAREIAMGRPGGDQFQR
jgi:hypothetical protein